MEGEKQLVINIDHENGFVSFDNLEDFKQIEVLGVLNCALATVDVIYKTKVVDSIKESLTEEGDERFTVALYEKVQETVKEILENNSHLKASEITLNTHLVDDLGLDSLDIVEVGLKVENEFQIEILDEDIEKIKTVDNLMKCIWEKL